MTTREEQAIQVFVIHGHRCILWALERLIESGQPTMKAVGSATSCLEALEQIDAATPDLFLLDFNKDIEESVANIATLRARSHTKILLLSALRDESLHDQAMLAGARGLVRPEDPPDAILKAIEKVHEGELCVDRITTGRIFGEYARRVDDQPVDPERARIASLTGREADIVAHAVNHPGASGKSLARMLNISERTLRNHLTSIYDKLNVSNRVALLAFAHEQGLASRTRMLSPRTDDPVTAGNGRAGSAQVH